MSQKLYMPDLHAKTKVLQSPKESKEKRDELTKFYEAKREEK